MRFASGVHGSQPGRRSSDRPGRSCLALEALEARLTPSGFTVDRVADDDLDGSLRFAIKLANGTPGADTITFALPAGAQIVLRDNLPEITDDLTITGPGAAALEINGAGRYQPFRIGDVTFTLSGLTIADGGANVTDAGLADVMGGALFSRGNSIVTNCVFRGNTALNEGGAVAVFSGTLRLSGCTFENNASGSGGAIVVVEGASATLRDNTFVGNRAKLFGGALLAAGPQPTTVINCTFVGNAAGGVGGAVAGDSSGSLRLLHSTISGNRAVETGGGVALQSSSRDLLQYNIVAGNLAGNPAAPKPNDVAGFADPLSAFNVIGVDTDLFGIQDGVQGNQVGTSGAPLDPGLAPLADNGGPTRTMALLPGSRAIDAGDSPVSGVPLNDQRGLGFRRVVGPAIDLGAFERQGADVIGLVFLDLDRDGFRGPADQPAVGLPVRLLDANGNAVATTTTAAAGAFRFPEVRSGEYQPAVDVSSLGGANAPPVLGNVVGVAGTQRVDAGEVPVFVPASLSGRVFVDRDEDGVFDPGDLPLAGVKVRLLGVDAGDNPVDRTAETDAGGGYAFVDLAPGLYHLFEELQPSAWPDGPDFAGAFGGQAADDVIEEIDLPFGADGAGYLFSELRTPTVTALELTPPSLPGVPLQVKVTVTPAGDIAANLAAGEPTLTLFDGDTVLGVYALQSEDGGTFTFDLPAGLAAGTHTLRAVYAGNDFFKQSDSAATVLVVNKLDPLIAVTVVTLPTADDPTALLKIVLAPPTPDLPIPQGTITVFDPLTGATTSAAVDAAGEVLIRIDLAFAGTHPLQIKFSGGPRYNPAGTNLSIPFNLPDAPPPATVPGPDTPPPVVTIAFPTDFGDVPPIIVTFPALPPGSFPLTLPASVGGERPAAGPTMDARLAAVARTPFSTDYDITTANAARLVPLRIEGPERLGIADGLAGEETPDLIPLRPLNAAGVISAAFESDERVELVELLYRGDTNSGPRNLLTRFGNGGPLPPTVETLAVAPAVLEAIPRETTEPGASSDLADLLMWAAGSATLIGGGWLLHRSRRPRPVLPALPEPGDVSPRSM